MSKQIYMEDISSISLEAMAIIQTKLKEFGIELTPDQEDKIFIPMENSIELICGCPDFRHHN